MENKRRIREEGHNRKFLAIVDTTPECNRAALYAALRAVSTNGQLVLLYVITPSDFQHWIGVENIMRAEALEEAETALATQSEFVREYANIDPETVVREGQPLLQIEELIEDDPDIAIMVLAASESREGPGPLVSAIVGKGSAFPLPVVVVPYNLSDQDIRDLC